jgi:hypothetical protein
MLPMFGKEWEDMRRSILTWSIAPGARSTGFWECMACGHLVPADEVRDVERKVDPETELLHAQWRV